MNMQSKSLSESYPASAVAPVEIPWTDRLYWSVRRELFEHRSIYLAPLAIVALILFGDRKSVV